MEITLFALQWLGGVLQRLIEIISNININMFNKTNCPTINIDKVECHIHYHTTVTIANPETATAYATAYVDATYKNEREAARDTISPKPESDEKNHEATS